ncbi:DUF2442 domain-containing protein [Aliidiomarina shirensis]|uniref:DUF2442 domain-containing protein n=1 Tax=Aliidiomarina shirensis TaxID=1048642 RepID=UPI001F544305|nr:DUF2442 domain-containing protein [Aliidiomarina shirensis]
MTLPKVSTVIAKPGYILALKFTDGKTGEVCIAESLHGPVFEPLRKPENFLLATVDDFGAVYWPLPECNHTPDYAPDALYRMLG